MTTGGAMGGSTGQVDVLFVEIQARLDGVEQSLRQMEQQTAEAGERAGGGLTERFGGALAALPAMAAATAAAVGAALAAGVVGVTNLAMEAEANVKMFQAQLGATTQEAEALGAAAEEVFRNNWGENLSDAAQMVKNVRQEVKGLTEEELAGVTGATAAIADNFEEEQQRVAAAVAAVMDATGASAQEATDLITKGFQAGLNTSGDFLDTLMEYSPQFQKAGVDAGQLFSLLESGAGKGTLGVDKVADTFKEFGLVLVEVTKDSAAAYAELGINHQAMVDSINDGSLTQAEAFQMVKDRLMDVQGVAERTRLGAAIFGTPSEDAAALLERIDLTKASLKDLAGATDSLNVKYTSLKDVGAGVWREIQVALLPVGKEILAIANDAMPSIKAGIASAMPTIQQFAVSLVEGVKQGKAAFATMQPYISQVINAVRPIIGSLGETVQAVFTAVQLYWNNVLRPVWTAMQPLVLGILKAIGTGLDSALKVITSVFNAVSALLRGDATQAWEDLKSAVWNILNGLAGMIQQTAEGLGETAVNLGKSIVAGVQRGLGALKDMLLQSLKSALQDLAKNAPSVIKPLLEGLIGAVPTSPGASQAPTGTGSTPTHYGSFEALAQAMGFAGRPISQEFGRTAFALRMQAIGAPGYEDGTHKGIDVATPVGVRLMAPVAGRAQLLSGWNDGFGNMVKLIDQQGRQIILGHLSELNQELVAEARRNNGWVNVQAGQFLGKTGSSGNSTGAHLHFEVRVNGKAVNPRTLDWLAGGAHPAPPTAGTTTFSQAGAVDPLKAAQPKTPAPLPKGLEAKPEDVKAEGLSWEAWLKHGQKAIDLLQDLQKAEASGSEKWRIQTEEKINKFKALGEVQASVFAYAEQRMAAAKAATEKQTQAQQEAAQRAREAAEEAARVQDQLRAGNITAAQQSYQRLQQMRDNDLRKAGDDAKARLAVEQRYAQEIYKAQQAIQNRIRNDAIKDAESIKHEPLKNQTIENAKNAYRLAMGDAQAERDSRLDAARKAAAAAEQAEQKASEESKRRADEAAKAAAARRLEIQRSLTDGELDLINQRAGAVLESYRREVEAAGDSAQDRLAVELEWGQRVYDARATQAETETRRRVLALERERNKLINAEGTTKEQRQALWKQYADKIALEEEALQGKLADILSATQGTINTAMDKATALTRESASGFDRLTESVLAAAEAGKFDAAAQQAAAEKLAELTTAAEDAGVAVDGLTVASRERATAALEAAAATQRELDAYRAFSDDRTAQWLSDADALAQMGDSAAALQLLSDAMAEVTAEVERGTSDGRGLDALFAAYQKLSKSNVLDGYKDATNAVIDSARELAKAGDYGAALEGLNTEINRLLSSGANMQDIAPSVAALRAELGKLADQRAGLEGVALAAAKATERARELGLTPMESTPVAARGQYVKPPEMTASPARGAVPTQAIAEWENYRNALDMDAEFDRVKAAMQDMSRAQLEQAVAVAETTRNQRLYALATELLTTVDERRTKALTGQINVYSDYARQTIPLLAAGLQALGVMSGQVAGEWAADLGSMVSDLTKFGTQIATGNFVGAAVTALSTIFSWFNRNREAAEKAAKATADYNAQFKFSQNGYGTRQVETYSTGILFWQTTHYKESVNEAQKALALSLEGGFVNGIKNGFNEALKSNDFGLFGKSLRQNVGQAVLNGLIDAFMNEAVLKNTIGPAIEQYLQTGNAGVLDSAITAATSLSEQFYKDIKPLYDRFNVADAASGTGANQTLFGNAPSIQLGIPRIEVTLPPVLLEGATAFAASVPIFDQATRRLLLVADRILAASEGGSPPPLSGRGGLT
ncbi:phage tail tape measure protein [Deinococcus lacus]|uniref:Phage tail tape measure protein n=1 Tax=Deinococcus lacus TaxID=392561 RepID=A0ABW1YBS5_9DEIO